MGGKDSSPLDLIAPCGMNCGLCIAYQFGKKNLNKKGFHKSCCPGCIPRGKGCLHFADSCSLLGEGKIRFCTECKDYPCKRLRALDKRYRTKYHLSMLENLDFLKSHGLDTFLQYEADRWACPSCGSMICCHNGLCLDCQIDVLLQDKLYRWGEQAFP